MKKLQLRPSDASPGRSISSRWHVGGSGGVSFNSNAAASFGPMEGSATMVAGARSICISWRPPTGNGGLPRRKRSFWLLIQGLHRSVALSCRGH